MEPFFQTFVVAALVAGSAVFATWRLLPARTKLNLIDATKPGSGNPVGRWLLRRRQTVMEELSHGCGSCAAGVKKPAGSRR